MSILEEINWNFLRKRYMRWWDKDCNTPLVQVYSPKEGFPRTSFDNWLLVHRWGEVEYAVNSFISWCHQNSFGGDYFPNFHINLGAGVLAAYLGSKPRIKSNTVWFEYPLDWNRLAELRLDPHNEWWRYTVEIIKTSGEICNNNFIIANTDLGGILDVAASLRGIKQILKDMWLHSAKLHRLLSNILEIWHQSYEYLHNLIQQYSPGSSAWLPIWSPKRYYPIQCDYSYMLSPSLYDEFVHPYLIEQCRRLDHVIYHLDGIGELPHLDKILSIPNLSGIQWVPGEGKPDCFSEIWLDIYTKILEKDKHLILYTQDHWKIPSFLKLLPKDKLHLLLIQTTCPNPKEMENLLNEIKSL